MMVRKIILGSIWLVFVVYAFFLSPPTASPQETLDLIINLSIGEWSGINPLVAAIFSIMGIFPWVYGAFILFDRPEQKISPYPFFIGSIGLGAFALLPYLVIREPNSDFAQEKNWFLKIMDSRLLAIFASVAIAVLIVWGAVSGDWSDFVSQWQSTRFINVMSLDFSLLILLLPVVVLNDITRRGVAKKWYWLAVSLPLFGTLIYWCLRPQLAEGFVQSEKIAA